MLLWIYRMTTRTRATTGLNERLRKARAATLSRCDRIVAVP